MIKSNPCKFCGSVWHTKAFCPKKKRSPIHKFSNKSANKELAAKAEWFEANPPDADGHWICYLQIHPMCPIILDGNTITQEHVKPKQRYPELKYVISNRKPSCEPCNRLKSGQSLETLSVTYPHLLPLLEELA